MKKNDLIKYLQDIKGNPDVVFYNDFVDDWQHINKPIEEILVKTTKEFAKMAINIEREELGMPKLTKEECKNLKESDYELISPEIKSLDARCYKIKKVILLSAKKRNKNGWNRMGNMSY